MFFLGYVLKINYWIVYRSLGLQLASFETKEKADSITTYLTNAGENWMVRNIHTNNKIL